MVEACSSWSNWRQILDIGRARITRLALASPSLTGLPMQVHLEIDDVLSLMTLLEAV